MVLNVGKRDIELVDFCFHFVAVEDEMELTWNGYRAEYVESNWQVLVFSVNLWVGISISHKLLRKLWYPFEIFDVLLSKAVTKALSLTTWAVFLYIDITVVIT